MDVDRWVFVEVGNSAAFPPIASIFFFSFFGEIGSKACQLKVSLELENKGKMIHGDLGEWESNQSKKL